MGKVKEDNQEKTKKFVNELIFFLLTRKSFANSYVSNNISVAKVDLLDNLILSLQKDLLDLVDSPDIKAQIKKRDEYERLMNLYDDFKQTEQLLDWASLYPSSVVSYILSSEPEIHNSCVLSTTAQNTIALTETSVPKNNDYQLYRISEYNFWKSYHNITKRLMEIIEKHIPMLSEIRYEGFSEYQDLINEWLDSVAS